MSIRQKNKKITFDKDSSSGRTNTDSIHLERGCIVSQMNIWKGRCIVRDDSDDRDRIENNEPNNPDNTEQESRGAPSVGVVGPSWTTAEVVEVDGKVCYGRVDSL